MPENNEQFDPQGIFAYCFSTSIQEGEPPFLDIEFFNKEKSSIKICGNRYEGVNLNFYDAKLHKYLIDLELSNEQLEKIRDTIDDFLKTDKNFDKLSLPGISLEKESENYKIYRITNVDSVVKLSEGTRWWNREKKDKKPLTIGDLYSIEFIAYDAINKDGYLLLITDSRGNWLYLFDDMDFTFTDPDDKRPENLDEELKKLLMPKLEGLTPSRAYYYACYILKSSDENLEKIISQDARCSYLYAKYALEGRWIPGEEAIAKDPQHSYFYAEYVLNSRFELGEPAIAKEHKYSYDYAKNILKDRFELGEPAIATSPGTAYLYAVEILKDRFELGEEAIAKVTHLNEKYKLFLEEKTNEDRK